MIYAYIYDRRALDERLFLHLSKERRYLKLRISRHHRKDPIPNRIDISEQSEEIETMAKAHWESWFDERIPALDNKTPRQAAKTKIGREKLEALLLQYENYDQKRDDADYFKADINYLRKELALNKS